MSLLEDLKEPVSLSEGLRLKPYKDTVGKLTIGYGRNLDDRGIRQCEAEFMMENDIKDAIEETKRLFPSFDELIKERQMVLVEMMYNLGFTRLSGFKKMIRAVSEKRWSDAADEMLDSRWARQVGQRARRLSTQMREKE